MGKWLFGSKRTDNRNNRKRNKMKIETETENFNNRNRQTETLKEKSKPIRFCHIFLCYYKHFTKETEKSKPKTGKPNKKAI